MRYSHVKAIAAVGNYGQIGKKGRLPWHDSKDLQHFAKFTMGGLCVAGKNTAKTLPQLPGRDLYVWRRTDDPATFAELHSNRDIWIIGGAHIYRAWMPYISMSIITHIDYNDKCDVYMPWLWVTPQKRKQREP